MYMGLIKFNSFLKNSIFLKKIVSLIIKKRVYFIIKKRGALTIKKFKMKSFLMNLMNKKSIYGGKY